MAGQWLRWLGMCAGPDLDNSLNKEISTLRSWLLQPIQGTSVLEFIAPERDPLVHKSIMTQCVFNDLGPHSCQETS